MEKTINKVELNGFVGINPEVRTMPNGNKILKFSLATSQSYKDREGQWVRDTTWHNIVMWNKMAEAASTDVKKGVRINVTGRLASHSYTNKEGNKKYSTEIIAASYEIVSVSNETKVAV